MYSVASLMSSSSIDNVPSQQQQHHHRLLIPSITNRRHLSVCSVCGDKASGKHYGVMSCDGCRGFFKRSVRRKIEYKCKGDSTCQVDVNRRNQCQACRFQRCLAMKMKPSAVQNERAPRHGPKRALPHPPPPPPPPPSSTQSFYPTPPRMQCWTPPTPAGYVGESPTVTMPFGFRKLPLNNASSPIWSSYAPSRYFLQHQSFDMSKCSSSSDSTHQQQSTSSIDETPSSLDVTGDDGGVSAAMCETASFILLESIRWLYLVPSFKELHLGDQLTLIEQAWSTLFLITAAETNKFNEKHDTDALDDESQFGQFQSLVKGFRVHTIDQTEYTLLKLIVIFSAPPNHELRDRFLVDKYRKDALFMLTEYTRNLKYRRLAELLMLLSNMQETMNTFHLDKLFFEHLINRIPMQHLLQNIVRHLPTIGQ